VRTYDALESEIIADRIFASATSADFDNFVEFDDAQLDEGDQYVARLALNDVEAEASFVEMLNDRRVAFGNGQDDDPAMVASLERLARTARIRRCRAEAAARSAEWDPVVCPLAAQVVARAQRAADAIADAAARAVTRAAIRARDAARARMGVSAQLRYLRRPAIPCSRPRAPHARRVRLSAVASAGSGSDEPGPEPPGQHDGTCLPIGRQR
jgi:hypothetical protein